VTAGDSPSTGDVEGKAARHPASVTPAMHITHARTGNGNAEPRRAL
jgi:hypothetical protein